MFYTQLFTLKRGPLARIWLAAHWEKKITKAHVFECNLEMTIKDIISPEVKIGLRTSGHLLLGVVRIYFRKAKYLLADCSDAVVKIRLAFRPGQTDLPSENLEACFNAITLPEEFIDFDLQLPDISDIDLADHFTLNQCRTEDITLKENYGSSLHVLESDFGHEAIMDPNSLPDGSFHSLANAISADAFGDEETGFTLLDLLMNSEDAMPTDLLPVHLNNEVPATPPLTAEPEEAEHQKIVSCCEAVERQKRGGEAVSETTLLENEKEAFTLEPVSILSSSERKRVKAKRRLLVDSVKELSNEAIRSQIADCSDLLAPLDMAPPTRQLMEWMETGTVHKLFHHHCVPVIHPHLQQLFPSNLLTKGWWKSRGDREQQWEVMRGPPGGNEESMQAVENGSLPSDVLELDSTNRSLDHGPVITPEKQNSHPAHRYSMTEESSTTLIFPEIPLEDFLLVSTAPDSGQTQSAENCQDFEKKLMNHKARRLLHFLRKREESSGSTEFSLSELCRGCNRTQAATTFFCLLVLKKQGVLDLHQDAPYADVTATLRLTSQQL